jgi:hypothetical protein
MNIQEAEKLADLLTQIYDFTNSPFEEYPIEAIIQEVSLNFPQINWVFDEDKNIFKAYL